MHESPIVTSIEDKIAWLSLNRPTSLNAMNLPLFRSLHTALETLRTDSRVRVVVIIGNGEAFCTGGDLTYFIDQDGLIRTQEILRVIEYGGEVLKQISDFPRPVIAAVNGLAVAGGLELALSCDIVLATEYARMGDGHSNFGLLPGGGGTARLVRVVGPIVAKYLTFTGELISVSELKALGLINEVIPDHQFLSRVTEVARNISTKSATGLARTKSLINDALDQSLRDALNSEREAVSLQIHSTDASEGLHAFREGRKPIYTDDSYIV